MYHRYGSRSRSDRYGGWGGFAPYVPVAERRAKAAKQVAKLQKSGKSLRPVTLAGHAIATQWWGKAWCTNLEKYADFANRIGRGRSYVRHGAVLDLQIQAGAAAALVQGSRPQPYQVNVKLSPLGQAARERVEAACRGQLGSLADLLAGKFPKALETLFEDSKSGLFPLPAQITFDCSCPDWASMCKHVAAVLYGIGARFDEDPGLFFALRGIDPQQLIGDVVQQRTGELLAKTAPAAAKVLDESDLGAVFGIELATPAATPAPVAAAVPAPSPATQARGRKPKATPPVQPPPATVPAPATAGTRQERMLAAMRAHARDGNALFWMRHLSWTESQTRNTLAGLMAKGLVTCPAKGRYAAI